MSQVPKLSLLQLDMVSTKLLASIIYPKSSLSQTQSTQQRKNLTHPPIPFKKYSFHSKRALLFLLLSSREPHQVLGMPKLLQLAPLQSC